MMDSFLAERYYPEPSTREAIAALAESHCAAARAMDMRHIRTIYVPADETCFTLFEAPSRERVMEASERFALGYNRVMPAIAVSCGPP
jgi:Nickel responsive protein SCO4226-like